MRINYFLLVLWLVGIALVCLRLITRAPGLALLLICLCLAAYLFCRRFIPSRCIRWLVWPWVALLFAVVLFLFRGGAGACCICGADRLHVAEHTAQLADLGG